MPEYEWKDLEIECPEGYGNAIQSFKILLHYSRKQAIKRLDRRAVMD